MAKEDAAKEYARTLREGLDRIRENKAAAVGEQLLKKDYTRVAREQGPEELQSLGACLQSGAEAANSVPALPRHTYFPGSHRVNAGIFAIVPSPFSGLDIYRLDVAVGLQPNADQFMDLNHAPPVKSIVWHLRAAADDSGFFWLNVESGERITSQELASVALKCLSKFLMQQAAQ
jgi:hypothetical protein